MTVVAGSSVSDPAQADRSVWVYSAWVDSVPAGSVRAGSVRVDFERVAPVLPAAVSAAQVFSVQRHRSAYSVLLFPSVSDAGFVHWPG